MKKLLCISALVLAVGGSASRPLLALPQEERALDQSSPVVAQPAIAQATAPSPPATQVILLNPGAAPRQALRFQLVEGTEQTGQSTLNMSMSGSFNGQAIPSMDMPKMEFGMSMKVDKVDANGDSHLSFGYTDVDVVATSGVPPGLIEAMKSQLQGLAGLEGKMVFSNQGQTKDFQMEVPEAFQPNLNQMLEQLKASLQQVSAPLPADPVGVGAEWQISPQTITINGMTVTQTARYKLVKLQDREMTLEMSIEQTALPQTLTLPGMPSGTSLKLQSLKADGEATIIMQLDRLFPSQATIKINSNIAMQAQDPGSGQPDNLLMNSAIEMTLESN